MIPDQIQSSHLLRISLQTGKNLTYPFVKVTPFQDSYGIEWLVITVISETQFMAEVRLNQQRTILLCGLALVGSIGLGIWISRRIRRSFIQLNQATQALAKSDFKNKFPHSYIKEIDYLYRSFAKEPEPTDCKLVELELIKRTEELDRFFSVALDLLCIANPEGYFLRLNPQWEKTLGYPLSELEGSRFLDYVHPDDLKNTLATLDFLRLIRV